MAQVKLDLDRKDDETLRTFAETHIDAMASNANFPTPVPATADFQTAFDDYDDKLGNVALLRAQLEAAVAVKNEARTTLEDKLRSRANYVQETTLGDAAKILTAAFQIREAATPTTELTAPGDLRATISDTSGAVDLQWDRVERARGYVVEYRLQTDAAWTRIDSVPTRARVKVNGLQSGKTYSFRVRALGPNELTSPWSDEAVKMAA